jgi:hypothetical protein
MFLGWLDTIFYVKKQGLWQAERLFLLKQAGF